MIVTAHQPAYLPWLGYFEKILRSDVYVFMDCVQFEARSFINRNKIKTAQGPNWLTVPVKSKGHREATLLDLEIDQSRTWKKDHLKSFYFHYKKAPRFEACYAKLEALYAADHRTLNDLCYDQLLFWLSELGVEKQIIKLSSLALPHKKSDLILEMCRTLQATEYISGALGKDYLSPEDFEAARITLTFQEYRHPVYPQLWGDFTANLSILDFWMNTDEYWKITGDPKHDILPGVGSTL